MRVKGTRIASNLIPNLSRLIQEGVASGLYLVATDQLLRKIERTNTHTPEKVTTTRFAEVTPRIVETLLLVDVEAKKLQSFHNPLSVRGGYNDIVTIDPDMRPGKDGTRTRIDPVNIPMASQP